VTKSGRNRMILHQQ